MSDSRRVEINDRTFVEFLDDGGCCIEQDLDRPGVTVCLEPEDRSTLLWALLEEEAGSVVEVEKEAAGSLYFGIQGRWWAKLTQQGLIVKTPRTIQSREDVLNLAYGLARAIQEQKRREVSGE